MRIWPVYKKELRLYFTTPLAWAILFVFMLVMGFFFNLYFNFFARLSMQSAMNPGMGRDLTVTEYVMRPLFSGFLSVILFLSLTPGRVDHAGAALGRHTDEILSGLLGLSADEVARLRSDGIV